MTVDVCPDCESQNVRLIWVAMNDDDFDSWVCLVCNHRWIS